ncbi:unnamed protein product, partial [Prorocentrum cordatum]
MARASRAPSSPGQARRPQEPPGQSRAAAKHALRTGEAGRRRAAAAEGGRAPPGRAALGSGVLRPRPAECCRARARAGAYRGISGLP